MAITLVGRPTSSIYESSPGGLLVSRWNSTGRFDKITYSFNVPEADLGTRLTVNVYEYGSDLLLGSNTYNPFRSGIFNVDISSFVKGYLYSEFAPDLDSLNSVDLGCSIRFYIGYTTGVTETRDILNPIYAVHSAMDVGNENGSNMKPFVPINYDIDDKALFLTKFTIPVLFTGYPLVISFLYDNYLAGKELLFNVIEQDVNGVLIDEYDYTIDTSKINRVNYIIVPLAVNSNCRKMVVGLKTGQDINDYYVDSGYVDEGYTQIL